MFNRSKPGKKVCFVDTEDSELALAQFVGEPTLLEVALRAQVDLSHSCAGNGTCGTCRVEIVEPVDFSVPRNEIENEMAEQRGLARRERLACQIVACDGMRIRVPNSDS